MGKGKRKVLVLRETYQAGTRRVSRSASLFGFPGPEDVLWSGGSHGGVCVWTQNDKMMGNQEVLC